MLVKTQHISSTLWLSQKLHSQVHFQSFYAHLKAATVVTRQTRMYCLFRTVISIRSFVQSVWVEHLWDYWKSYTFYFLWERKQQYSV